MAPTTDIWTDETERLLIDLVEARPILWDYSLADYRRTDRKDVLWEEIADLMGSPFSVDVLKKRFANMRGTYCENERKLKDSKRSGSGADAIFRPRWPLYERLQFLRKCTTSASSSSNMNVTLSSQNSFASTQSESHSNLTVTANSASLSVDSSSVEVYFDENSKTFCLIPPDIAATSTSSDNASTVSDPCSSPFSPPLALLARSTSPSLTPVRPASAPPSDRSKRPGDDSLFAKRGVKKPASSVDAVVTAMKEIVAQPIVLPQDCKQDDVDAFLVYLGSKLRAMNAGLRKECETDIMNVVFSKSE